MLDRDYRDIVAGLGLTVFGAATALYALTSYTMGTVARMGPGMMPVSLGALLAAFGLAIAIPAYFRKGEKTDLRFRALVVLSVSIVSFALMIETFGLVPSVFATTLIATFAETKISMVRSLILGSAMSLLTWAVFSLGLRLPIPAFDWPF